MNLTNTVYYTISNGYVNKPIMFILFIINVISKGTKHLLAYTDILGTFTVPIMNLTGNLYGISKGLKHLLAFTDI